MADIELVIKIPEDTVDEIKDNAMFAGSISSEILWDVTSAIVNGIALPKGHGRLIDADAFIKKVCTYQQTGCGDCKHSLCCPEDVPTIIEADKEQEDNGFFDEIMDDKLEDEETYEKIKEIIAKVKEQEE